MRMFSACIVFHERVDHRGWSGSHANFFLWWFDFGRCRWNLRRSVHCKTCRKLSDFLSLPLLGRATTVVWGPFHPCMNWWRLPEVMHDPSCSSSQDFSVDPKLVAGNGSQAGFASSKLRDATSFTFVASLSPHGRNAEFLPGDACKATCFVTKKLTI